MTDQLVRMQMAYQIGQASLSFEACIPQDSEVSAINELADKLESVATRQMLKGQLANFRQQLEQADRHIMVAQHDLDRLLAAQERKIADWELSDKRGRPTMTPKEQADIKGSEDSLTTFIKQKNHIQEQLKSLEDILAA
jgi:hypothetical protein